MTMMESQTLEIMVATQNMIRDLPAQIAAALTASAPPAANKQSDGDNKK